MTATTIDELQVVITAQAAGFKSQIDAVKRTLAGLDSTAKGLSSRIPKSFAAVGTSAVAVGALISSALVGAFRSVAAMGGDAVNRLDTLNNFPRVMSNLGVSADLAEKSISVLSDKLTGLPTTLDTAAMAVQRLTSANGSVAASTSMFLALNNAILAGGAPMDLQRSAIEQLTQAYSRGSIDMVEWRSAMTAMPAQLKQVAQAMDFVSADALGESLREGEVSMDKFMGTIMRLNTEGLPGFSNFETQARNSTGGVATSIANVRTAFVRGMANIMDAIGQSNIASFFNGVANAVNSVIPYIVGFVRAIGIAVSFVTSLFGGGGAKAKAMADATNAAAGAAGSVASGAGAAADSLGDAAGKAKKLHEQLAGFDEMNVLTEPTDSSGGSGGGGGGAGDIPAFDFDSLDTGLDGIKSKADEIAEALGKIFTDFLKGFEFNKIAFSFNRLWDDIVRGAKPVFAVIADAWKSYLQPFIYWVGNDLLPAFLNAVGGAVSFLGNVIGATWVYLKPFIDAFLVPIAQFTGGVIVGVLNAIGDSLRWISEQQTVVAILGGIATSILLITAAYQGFQLVAGIIAGIQLAINGVMVAGTAASGAYALGIGAVTMAQNAAATASTLWSGALSLMNPVVLGIAAAIAGVVVVLEAVKLAQMNANLEAQNTITFEERETQLRNMTRDAIKGQEDALKSYTKAKEEQTNASLALMGAEDQQTAASDRLNKMIKDGVDPSSREFKRAQLELESANYRVKDAQDKLTGSSREAETQFDKVGNAVWAQIRAGKEDELQKLAQAGKYDQVNQKLKDLANSTHEYKDANGNMTKFSSKDMETMALSIGDSISKVQKDYKKFWDASKESVDQAARNVDEVKTQFTQSGKNFSQGLANGINADAWLVEQAARNTATKANNAYKKALDIHSPSRVMKKGGGFFSQGIAEGIRSKTAEVTAAARAISDKAAAAIDFSGAGELRLANMNFSTSIPSSLRNFTSAINAELEQTPVHVVVNVGGDTLVDKVVQGINDQSFMSNTATIAV